MRSPRRHAITAALAMVCGAASAQPRPPAPQRPPAAPELIDYRVRPGDTCVLVARRLYRNAARTDLIHQYNPTLGRPPHHLVPGSVLRVPRRAPAATNPPVAFLTGANNVVEVQTVASQPPRPGQRNDPLFRGTRVSTQSHSSAEVTFNDETQIRLYEQTLVVILGDTNTRVRRQATARDTTLVTGSLRAFLGGLDARATPTPGSVVTGPARPAPAAPAVAIRTPGGRVALGRGEAQISIEDNSATTLAVYRGSSALQAAARTVTVPEGFATRAERGRPPTPPRRLPTQPAWVDAPPALRFTDGTVDVTASYRAGAAAPGVTPPEPAQWHVQVARDPIFDDMLLEAHTPATVDHLDARGLGPGRYHFRVSALDAERFEGPWSPEVTLTVVRPRLVPTAQAHRATVELPPDLFCAVDDAPLARTGGAAMEVERLHPHRLRCAATADAEPAVYELAPETRGPYTAVSRIADADARARTGRVRVRLIDAAGAAYTEGPLTAQVRDEAEVSLGALTPSADEPGVWSAPARWSPQVRAFSLRLTTDVGEAVDTDALAVPQPPPPEYRPVDELARRVWLRGEVLGAGMLSAYQRTDDPGLYWRNTPNMSFGVAGNLRAGIDLLRPDPGRVGPALGPQLLAGYRFFPRTEAQAGQAVILGGGLRVSSAGERLRWHADASLGAVFTGDLLRLGFDLGVGLDIRVARAWAIGPTVRYFHIVQPDGGDAYAALDEDARVISVGVGVTLQPPPRGSDD